MQDDRFDGGKFPNSADSGMALSEFADDTAPGSRSEALPPKGSSAISPAPLRGSCDRMTLFVRENPGVVAAVGGLLLGFAAGIYIFSRRGR
jgi:hypothetical protein